jgi:hypothetical protein
MATYSPSHPSLLMPSSSPMEYDLDHRAVGNSSQNQSRASWDQHYQRRGRTQERFDFPTSDDFDLIADSGRSIVPVTSSGSSISSRSQHRQHNPIDHPGRQRRPRPRPRSADSRPQYHTTPSIGGMSSASTTSRDRATCLNMFYPGELTTSATGTAPSSRSSGSAHHGLETILYYQSELPRYNPVIHDDTAYARQQGLGRVEPITGTLPLHRDIGGGDPDLGSVGLASTPTGIQDNNHPPFESPSGQRQPKQMETAVFMLPNNPYESTIGMDPRFIGRRSPFSPSTRLQQPTNAGGTTNYRYEKDRRYYDYVKENLIMFGDGYGRPGIPGGDAPSVSTGLSQEELLQRKRREETWRKRKEKRQHPRKPAKTNKVVNLPTTLFSPHTNRQQQQQLLQQQQRPRQQQQQIQELTSMHRDVKSGDGNQDHDSRINQMQELAGIDEVFHPSFSNSGIGMKDYTGQQTAASLSFSPKQDVPEQSTTGYKGSGGVNKNDVRTRGGQHNGDDEESANSSYSNNKGGVGIRGSMVSGTVPVMLTAVVLLHL